MIRLSIAALALSLMLMASCAYHRGNDRSESVRTETTRTHEGKAEGSVLRPGERSSQQNQTIETHRESTTTR